MSADVVITLEPEALLLIARAKAWPVSMMRGIARAHDEQNQLTIGHANKTKMSQRSATTLGVVTNRLRSSLHNAEARISGGAVLSAIGTNVVYGGVHEFGFVGTVQVKSFTRRRFGGGRDAQTVTIERVKFLRKDGKIVEKRSSRKRKVASSVTVRAHSRKMNMPQRSYIQSSIIERRADYGRAISAEIIAELGNPGT